MSQMGHPGQSSEEVGEARAIHGLASGCSSCAGRAIVDENEEVVFCPDCLERAVASVDWVEIGTVD